MKTPLALLRVVIGGVQKRYNIYKLINVILKLHIRKLSVQTKLTFPEQSKVDGIAFLSIATCGITVAAHQVFTNRVSGLLC